MAQSFETEPETTALSDEKKEYFKKLLTQILDEALKDNNTFNGANLSNDKLPDPSDRATAELALDFNQKMQERIMGLIRKVEGALERIEDDTYGICDECEEEISEGRLKARPITALCIECKRNQEDQERHMGM